MHACMCVYIYITHICIYICIHIYIHTYIHTYILYIHKCIYTYIHTYEYTYIHTYVYTLYAGISPGALQRGIFGFINMYMHVYVYLWHVCTYIRIYILIFGPRALVYIHV
jgi:hypothetical protein